MFDLIGITVEEHLNTIIKDITLKGVNAVDIEEPIFLEDVTKKLPREQLLILLSKAMVAIWSRTEECIKTQKEAIDLANKNITTIEEAIAAKEELIASWESLERDKLDYEKLGFEKGLIQSRKIHAKIAVSAKLENDPIQLAKAEIEHEYWKQKGQFKRRGYSAEFKRKMAEKHPVITDIKTIERLITKLNKQNDDYPFS